MEKIDELIMSIRYAEKLLQCNIIRKKKENIESMLCIYYKQLNKEVEKAHNEFIFVNIGSRKFAKSIFESIMND